MDNSGRGPLLVPGFNDIPIETELPCEERFAHGMIEWCQAPAVTAHEVTMIQAMNVITDLHDWHIQIFDDAVAEDWKMYIGSLFPRLSDIAWDWCLQELRDKAIQYRNTGFVRVLDTGSCICKGDGLISTNQLASFEEALSPLLSSKRPDSTLRRIVDSRRYPLVYGETQVLQNGGTTILENPMSEQNDLSRRYSHPEDHWPNAGCGSRFDGDPARYLWSPKYQALPCDVERADNGSGVQIVSYINGLHPVHRSAYSAIETLIAAAIDPWNVCLIRGRDKLKKFYKDPKNPATTNGEDQFQRGPVPLRIVTFGPTFANELGMWSLPLNPSFKKLVQINYEIKTQQRSYRHIHTPMGRLFDPQVLDRAIDFMKPASELSPHTWELAHQYLRKDEFKRLSEASTIDVPPDWKDKVWSLLEEKESRIRYLQIPEPGTEFSYEDWKVGRNMERAIVNMIASPVSGPLTHPRERPFHQMYQTKVQSHLDDTGLQIFVDIDSIELDPSRSVHHPGPWQCHGLLNEHIVAAAVIVYDVHNVTPCHLAFRQETPMSSAVYRYDPKYHRRCCYDDLTKYRCRNGYNEIEELAEIFGFEYKDMAELYDEQMILPMQTLGEVELRHGRLVAYPNTIEHRFGHFELEDPSRTGHLRAIKLYLVDPNYRICSTRNVPAQQHHWWKQAIIPILMRKGLPYEIADTVLDYCQDWPMGELMAEKHRSAMDREEKWRQCARYVAMEHYYF